MSRDSRAAGVLFTINPSNGDRSKIVIEANWGLGESVVAGEADPDRFTVDKVTLEIVAETIAPKWWEYRADAERSGTRRAVPPERRNMPCLTRQEVVALAELAKRVERAFGAAQDIEWAIDRNAILPDSIVLLQSRPETAWKRKRPSLYPAPPDGAIDYVLRGLLDRTPARH